MVTEERASGAVSPPTPPTLLVELEPWGKVFRRNLRDLLLPRREAPLRLTSRPAAFWPDVFVPTRPPYASLRQSFLYHIFVILTIVTFPTLWRMRPQAPPSATGNRTLTYYEVSEYLPSLSTGSAPAKVARKGRPKYARQPLISIPAQPDNSTQTIVNPAAPKILLEEVKIPNVVVWTPVPAPAPIAATARPTSQLTLPWLAPMVVAPPPEAHRRDAASLPKMPAPAVVGAPPTPEALQRRVGELNIARSHPAVLIPSLPVPEQRASSGESEGGNAPPPPSTHGAGGGARAAGQLIALGLSPTAVGGPVEIPPGSRRGIFAATPEGSPDNPGTPEIAGGGSGPGGTGSGETGGPGSGTATNPSGVFIGGGPPATGPVAVVAGESNRAGGGGAVTAPGNSVTREQLLAAARAPALPPNVVRETAPATNAPTRPAAGSVESQVFGPKRFYSMTINMPNLTSAGGSWIVRFAELKETTDRTELTAPSAMNKVDPAFPADYIRRRVEGRVLLYAVIRADGSVTDVRVIQGFDDLLDENARLAMTRWRFRPATKHGTPVDLEAIVEIPFKARPSTF
ncbi:MAG TPA: TonB family protein [Terriglobales bacterium]|nr:TonB family protein [Terriglobales bacterium]